MPVQNDYSITPVIPVDAVSAFLAIPIFVRFLSKDIKI